MSKQMLTLPEVMRRYSPEGLEHLRPRQMMTYTQMQKEFRVGGLTPSGFIGRCKRQGREISSYRCARGVNHFRFGEIVARARAQNLEVTPVPVENPEPMAKANAMPAVAGKLASPEKHALNFDEQSNALTGRSLRSTAEIVRMAKKGTDTRVSGVYFLVKDDEVVYVGQSVAVHSRVATHFISKDFDCWSYIPCEKKGLDILESLYIHFLQPKLNGKTGQTDQLGSPVSLDDLLKRVRLKVAA